MSEANTGSRLQSAGGDGNAYEDYYSYDEGLMDAPDAEQNYAHTSSSTLSELTTDEFPGMRSMEERLVGEEEAEAKSYRLWDVEYYSFLFDVDTTEVLARLTRSVVPFSFSFLDSIQNNPDVYGPFWVVTTLIFLNAAAGNFAQWIHEKNQFRYHFETITFGAATFYCYVTIVPIILWIVLRWLEMRITLLQILCLYGYAMFIYLPVAVLCIIPLNFLRWLLVLGCGAWSTVFLCMNLYPLVLKDKWHSKTSTTTGCCILGAVTVCHMALALTIKLYFFHYPS